MFSFSFSKLTEISHKIPQWVKLYNTQDLTPILSFNTKKTVWTSYFPTPCLQGWYWWGEGRGVKQKENISSFPPKPLLSQLCLLHRKPIFHTGDPSHGFYPFLSGLLHQLCTSSMVWFQKISVPTPKRAIWNSGGGGSQKPFFFYLG